MIPVKILGGLLKEIDEMNLKYIWKCKDPRVDKLFLKKNKFEEIILCDSKTDYRSMVMKRVCYWV